MDKKNWYCVKFDVPKENIKASDFAKKMQNFLEQIEVFNHSIVRGIDETYQVVSYIEDFETGSIKFWLLDRLQKIDDNAIDKFVDSPIKTTISTLLKVCKKKAIEKLSEQTDDYEQRKCKIVDPIIEEIDKVKNMGNNLFVSIDKEKILEAVNNMSLISNELGGVKFIEDYDNQAEEIEIAKDFRFEKKLILDNKEFKEIIEITEGCMLVLLTPTFKEDCKWEFDDAGEKILCDLLDYHFFNDVKDRKKSIKANDVYMVKKQTTKKFENGKWKKQYAILKVEKIIEPKALF